MAEGLYNDLISACKSGKNPSPIKEATKKIMPNIVKGLSSLSLLFLK